MILRHPADRRSVALVLLYLACLALLYTTPSARSIPLFVLACALSFLNTVVIHNHVHRSMFRSARLNRAWSCVLSFGALYPASANVPAHNVVHHAFSDDGAPDWAAPGAVDLGHPLLDLLHFPNVAGPDTFAGVQRWAARPGRAAFRAAYRTELAFAFGLTGLLLAADVWSGLFFVVLPQLFGARNILRINLIQHADCDTSGSHHSRDFLGRAFNAVMCNNGYHTVHHRAPGVHWSELPALHAREASTLEPELAEPSLARFVWRRFVLARRSAPRGAGLASGPVAWASPEPSAPPAPSVPRARPGTLVPPPSEVSC